MTGALVSGVGIVVILLLAVLISTDRRNIDLWIAGRALALQIAVSFCVLFLPLGRSAVAALSDAVLKVVEFSDAGIGMVFGELAGSRFGTIFAFVVLPIIVFFAALMAVLYHLRIMQWIVAGIGRCLEFLIGTRPIESLNAAANVFVGMTEAPLAIRPYLKGITGPQLFAIMCSGLASIAGTVMVAYAKLGIQVEYLIAASFMAAPGGLLMAKIIVPDEPGVTQPPQDVASILKERSSYPNVILAAAAGAQVGLRMAVNIGAMLIAFISLIAVVNGLISATFGVFSVEGITAQSILGWIFSPLMFLLGVPWAEAQIAGGLFGEKLILNEFVAYSSLAAQSASLSPNTVAICTFALCGFANLSSIAILLGGLGNLIPERMNEIARYGLRAVAAGSLSNLMSAAIVGLLLSVQ